MQTKNIIPGIDDNDDNSSNYLVFEDMDLLFDQFYIMQDERTSKGSKLMAIDAENMTMLCIFLVACGLRTIEGFRARVEDFDFNNNLLTLPETKTGYKRCKCSKWEKGTRKMISCDSNCSKCKGQGRIRVNQYTTIWRNAAAILKDYFVRMNYGPKDHPWPYYTKIFNNYLKEAGTRAGIKILIVKDQLVIKNVSSYIFRNSCSRIMRDLKADYELRQLKQRHKPGRDVQIRYDNYTINDLAKWEAENISWPDVRKFPMLKAIKPRK